VEAAINVDKVVNLTEDFIMGMDISSVMSEFKSGVTYKDFDGNSINNITDFCKFLKTCGVTTIRVRVWNNPTDSEGNSYGGGANDLATAVKIAEGCEAAGLGMLIDFHCSDFWTDPSKQQAPKAWNTYTLEEKEEALKTFITDSLTQIKKTGAKISMVQVGNETTSGFIGETSVANMCALFSAGSAAIREFDENIKVVIHVTNPEKSNMTTWAENLANYGVNYDVLATSYYPSWHGTFANLKSQLETVKNTYGKEVMVAETSYAYTLEDTDGHENTILEGSKNAVMECETQYPFSAQGQASFLRDLINTVNEAGGLGVFYWEPAWITVGDTTGLSGEEYSAKVADNKQLWEKNGSGWASSYSIEYDPDDAGIWYGGSAVDNQALFAADGSPLAGINVWKYVRTGAYTNNVSVEEIASAEETIEEDGDYTLPDTLTVTYNNGTAEESVSWEEADAAKIDISVVGTYVVNGTVQFSKVVDDGTYSGQTGAAVTYTLTVKAKNLIGADWSFENGGSNFDGLDVNGTEIKWTTEDSLDGTYALHWWLASAGNSVVTYLGEEKSGITLSPGTYTFEAQTQGYAGDTVALSILEHGTDSVLAVGDAVTLNGWKNWLVPTVSFEVTSETTIDLQMNVGIQAGGWGTIDSMYLYRTGDVKTADGKDPADGKKPTDNKAPTTGKVPTDGKAPATGKVPADGEAPATGKAPADTKTPTANNTMSSHTTTSGTTSSSTTSTSIASSNTTSVVTEDKSVSLAGTGTSDSLKETNRNITVTSDESEKADDAASEETTDDSISPDESEGNTDDGLADDAGTTAIADEEAPLSATEEKNTFHWYWLLLLAAVAVVIGKLGYDYTKKSAGK
jgi:arabinogalactan endo-1,4-beta-galactosidase